MELEINRTAGVAMEAGEVFIFPAAPDSLVEFPEDMINPHCESLKETYASLAYDGILLEEDVQCFRVNAGVEAAFLYR